MATVPGSQKDQHEPDKRPESANRHSNELVVVWSFVLVLLSLSAFVAWLLYMAPELAGSSGFQYWIIP